MRRRKQTPADEAWIDKQIAALTRQGVRTVEIIERYHIHPSRIARVRKEQGLTVSVPIQEFHHFDEFRIPEMETHLSAKPKRYSEHYSQVIWR